MKPTRNTSFAVQKFEALALALEVIRELRGVMGAIRRRDRKLAGQIADAASSMALNLGEGRRRAGKDRMHFYRIAAGSADEARIGLWVAEAWGHVAAEDIAPIDRRLDSVLAMLWTITGGS